MNETVRAPVSVTYRVGGWTVDPMSRRVHRAAEPGDAAARQQEATLSPRAMDVLAFLAERAGATVRHEELLDAFWRGDISPPNAVHKAIAEIRSVLDDNDQVRHVETIPRRGYRLVAPVQRIEAPLGVELLRSPAVGGTVGLDDASAERGPIGDARRLRLPRAVLAAGVLGLLAAVGLLGAWLHDAAVSPRAEPGPAARAAASQPSNPRATLGVMHFGMADAASPYAYLGVGLSEAVTARLSQLAGLEIRKLGAPVGTSPEAFQGLDGVLQGDVTLAGNQVQVRLRLTNPAAGKAVATRSFEHPIARLQDMEREIAEQTLSWLKVELDPEERVQMRREGTRSVDAYVKRLEAGRLICYPTPENVDRARALVEEAIRLDPDFAYAYVLNAHLIVMQTKRYPGIDAGNVLVAQLEDLSRRAARNAPASGAAEYALLSVAEIRGDLGQQERLLRALIKRGRAPVREFLLVEATYGELLNLAGLFDDGKQYWWYSVSKVETARRPAPEFLRLSFTHVAWRHGARTALDRIAPRIDRSLAVGRPVSIDHLWSLSTLNASLGRFDKSNRYLRALQAADTGGLSYRSARALVRAWSGELKRGSSEYVNLLAYTGSRLAAGSVAFRVGDIEGGIEHWRNMHPFERGVFNQGRWSIEFHVPASIRADARYQRLLDEMGVGQRFRRQLEAGVRELTPHTGLMLVADAPDRAVLGTWRDDG